MGLITVLGMSAYRQYSAPASRTDQTNTTLRTADFPPRAFILIKTDISYMEPHTTEVTTNTNRIRFSSKGSVYEIPDPPRYMSDGILTWQTN